MREFFVTSSVSLESAWRRCRGSSERRWRSEEDDGEEEGAAAASFENEAIATTTAMTIIKLASTAAPLRSIRRGVLIGTGEVKQGSCYLSGGSDWDEKEQRVAGKKERKEERVIISFFSAFLFYTL